MDVKEVKKEQVEEMRSLVASGDLNLAKVRATYESKQGTATRLTDDELLVACAAQEDDDDDELVGHINALEALKPTADTVA